MDEWKEYVMIAFAVGVVVFSLAAFTASPALAPRAGTTVYKQPVSLQQPVASSCGDLTSAVYVQHLSHHPGIYADCLKQVDPAFLKQVTGRTLQQILGTG